MKISKYNKINGNKINGKLKKRKTRRRQYKKRNNRHITKHNKHKRTINRRRNGRNKTVRKKKGGFISPALVFGSAAGIGLLGTILGVWGGNRRLTPAEGPRPDEVNPDMVHKFEHINDAMPQHSSEEEKEDLEEEYGDYLYGRDVNNEPANPIKMHDAGVRGPALEQAINRRTLSGIGAMQEQGPPAF